MSKMRVFSELWEYSRANKKYWLLPIISMLVLLAVLLVVAKGSALGPFIYALF